MNDMTHPSGGKLYRQIYARVQSSIADGQLQPGDRLPSARAYAQELGVARGTVDLAYAILAGEGYIETNGRAGTRVARGVARMIAAAEAPTPTTQTNAGFQHGLLPLAPGVPAFDLFPRKVWTQLVRRHVRGLGRTELTYPDPQGSPKLREAVAAYLGVSRGVPRHVKLRVGLSSSRIRPAAPATASVIGVYHTARRRAHAEPHRRNRPASHRDLRLDCC